IRSPEGKAKCQPEKNGRDDPWAGPSVIALDTNVLVRVLVDDPGEPEQVKAARASVKDAGEIFCLSDRAG
ncbi:MAG: hypothetical protein ACRD1R_01950, partial [Acidobacteriota bacterium]